MAGRVWADPSLDDASWATIAVPSLWEQAGYPDMDGIAWYRTSFTLTAEEAARGVTLGLGAIDDADISWVNGVEIGRTNNYSAPRAYQVPPAALRAGRNVLAVRVNDTGGGGGIYGDSSRLFLQAGSDRRPLGAQWKFRVGAITLQADGQHINKVPTVVYNKMVHPLLPFPIKGVIWYQGESNADRVEDAVAYEPLFKTMITSWRREWNVGDFPFLWVQLANYMAPDSQPRGAERVGHPPRRADRRALAPSHGAGGDRRRGRGAGHPSEEQAGRRRQARARGARGRVRSAAHLRRPDASLSRGTRRLGRRAVRQRRHRSREPRDERATRRIRHRRRRPKASCGPTRASRATP